MIRSRFNILSVYFQLQSNSKNCFSFKIYFAQAGKNFTEKAFQQIFNSTDTVKLTGESLHQSRAEAVQIWQIKIYIDVIKCCISF